MIYVKGYLLLVLWVNVVLTKKSALVRLDEDSWSQLLTGEWMVEFYAPWCPACKQLEPQWNHFSTWSDDLGIKVASVDVTVNPGLSGRFMITALPTIYHVKDGVFRAYKGSRDSNSFVSFIEEKKWEKIESVSKWKDPSSVQMSLVSYFFKISMALRAVHNRLVEEYGIPYWGSYILFAFGTIFMGALLGLLIVFVIDFFFPAPPPPESLVRDSPGAKTAAANHENVDSDGVRKRKTSDNEDEGDKESNEVEETKKTS